MTFEKHLQHGLSSSDTTVGGSSKSPLVDYIFRSAPVFRSCERVFTCPLLPGNRGRPGTRCWVSTWWTTGSVRTCGRPAWSTIRSSGWRLPSLRRRTSLLTTSPWAQNSDTGEDNRAHADTHIVRNSTLGWDGDWEVGMKGFLQTLCLVWNCTIPFWEHSYFPFSHRFGT